MGKRLTKRQLEDKVEGDLGKLEKSYNKEMESLIKRRNTLADRQAKLEREYTTKRRTMMKNYQERARKAK